MFASSPYHPAADRERWRRESPFLPFTRNGPVMRLVVDYTTHTPRQHNIMKHHEPDSRPRFHPDEEAFQNHVDDIAHRHGLRPAGGPECGHRTCLSNYRKTGLAECTEAERTRYVDTPRKQREALVPLRLGDGISRPTQRSRFQRFIDRLPSLHEIMLLLFGIGAILAIILMVTHMH